jgi:hypothetical protein
VTESGDKSPHSKNSKEHRMKIHQLSVFVENKPGRLRAPCEALAAGGVNIVTLSLADTQHYGILRLIVRRWELAKQLLEAAGFAVKVTEVLAVEVPDRPGGLAQVLAALEQAAINVEYMYAFTEKLGDRAVLVLRLEDPDAALAALAGSALSLISDVDLFQRFAPP